MDLGLKDKTAIVTGGAAGIGKATSMALAEEGVDVAIFDIDTQQLEATADEIRKATGRRITPYTVDMMVRDAIEENVDRAAEAFGRIDILVNNAGASKFGDPLTMEAEAFADAMALKYLGYVYCSRAASQHMIKQKWGRIVNVIGSGGKQTLPVHIPGGASNSAIWLFTKGFGLHVAPHGVLVNGISPGLVATERMIRLIKSSAQTQGITFEEAEREYYKDIPLGRAAKTEEVTSAVLFLASERASYFVGSNLFMDGGLITAI